MTSTANQASDKIVLCDNVLCDKIARHDVRLADSSILALCRMHATWAVENNPGARYL